MAKRVGRGEQRGEGTVFTRMTIPGDRPTGNQFRLRGKPSWFDANSPVYTKSNPVCSVVGKGERCPVQLFFDDGHAKLRFCEDIGKKGRVIDIGDNFVGANAKAQELCKCWTASAQDPRKRSFKGCGLDDAPLGGLSARGGRRRSRSKRSGR
jgi:hypothetical protein